MADFEVTIELGNDAIEGNTKTFRLHIADEDLNDLDPDDREFTVDTLVSEEVLSRHVYWSWKDADDE
jgi:hypothetical protein